MQVDISHLESPTWGLCQSRADLRRLTQKCDKGGQVLPRSDKNAAGAGNTKAVPELWLCPELPSLHWAFQGSRWTSMKTEGRVLVQKDVSQHLPKLGAGVQAILLLSWGWITTGWVVLEDQAAGQSQPEVTESVVHLLRVLRPTPPTGVHNRKDNNFPAQSPEKLAQLHGSTMNMVQHPWPCKSSDLLTQANQEPQDTGEGRRAG